MLFEVWLVRQEVISAAQLVDAIEYQLAARPRLGELALSLKKLTMKQMFAVLSAQVDDAGPFGETAVKLGFLTKRQVTHLLKKQHAMTPPLTECLVAVGAIDQETIAVQRHAFRFAEAPTARQPMAVAAPSISASTEDTLTPVGNSG